MAKASDEQRLADLRLYENYRREYALYFYKPYLKQIAFHVAGAFKRERAFLAGNQLGKTLSAGNEVAMHATGIYPEDWKGRRFLKPIRGWVSGITGESTRDNPQRILLGQIGSLGTGAIPKQYIIKTSAARGIPDAIETVIVRHVSGGESQLTFKAYADGREKWQGETLDLIWFDEEPPLNIYIEGLTRTNATKGFVFLTLTPLLGMSDVVMRFWNDEVRDGLHPDRALIQMTIDDVEHYSAKEKKTIVDAYPEHEREARALGIPFLGSGKIFPVTEESIKEKTISVPDDWKQLIGLDFGWDHPTAAVRLAYDETTDCIHVTAAYRQSQTTPILHAVAIKSWGEWVPVAWPHDGLQHDKGSGEQLSQIYRKAGLKMVSEKASFPDDRGNGVEAGLMEMLQRMQTGRLKVDSNLHEWFEEFRMYHRKEGKVVKERDDLMSATRYAIMMLRFAKSKAIADPVPDRYRKKASHGRSWMSA